MIMLYRTLLKLKERNGLTDDLKNKIDSFFATGRITEEQYNGLMDIEPVIEEPAEEIVDEIEPDAELPEGIEIPAENEISIPDEDFNDETEYDVDFSNEGLEEPSLDEVDYSAVNEESDLPEEISVPKSEDMIVESSSSDFMGSFNADDVNLYKA